MLKENGNFSVLHGFKKRWKRTECFIFKIFTTKKLAEIQLPCKYYPKFCLLLNIFDKNFKMFLYRI